MRRRSAQTRRLTPLEERIANARGGSPDRLWELYYYIEDPDDRSLEVIELVLGHLSIDNMKAHATALTQAVGARAVACIFILLACVSAFQTHPNLRDLAIVPVGEAIEAICVWAHFCIHFELAPPDAELEFLEMYNRVGRLLVQLSLYPELHARLASTAAYHKLAIRLWMTRGITKDLDHDNQYHALLALGNAVGDPEDDQTDLFIQQIMARPAKFATEFAEVTIERSHRIRDMVFSRQLPPATVVDYILFLISIVCRVTGSCDSLRITFIKVDYLVELSSDLNAVSAALVELDCAHLLKSMLQPTMSLACHVYDPHTPFRSVRNSSDVLSGGLLTHTLRILASLPASEEHCTMQGITIIRNLGRYTAYPSVIEELGRMPALGTFITRGLENDWRVSALWDAFCITIQRSLGAQRSFIKEGGLLCDNMLCPRTGTGLHSDLEPKACVGCSSVVYCSVACQKEDWAACHRAECEHARNDYARLRTSRSWYSHRSRAFHVAYIAFLFNKPHTGYLRKKQVKTRKWIPFVDTSDICVSIRLVPLEGDSWWKSPGHDESLPEYHKYRFSALKEEYTHEDTPGNVRLVQAFFPLGAELGVHLTVKLTQKNGTYVGGYSIVRYGPPPVPSEDSQGQKIFSSVIQNLFRIQFFREFVFRLAVWGSRHIHSIVTIGFLLLGLFCLYVLYTLLGLLFDGLLLLLRIAGVLNR
ncbi:hypothetical protein DFP72DRAFT_1066005 [Ephemerocybe angulata]|uniref:MYND-type domain-containing protein n=1 Tax=Ephemerocybe angulata TaxID=980116 RepID=A0A8H6M9L9_9AGAR|nr:hypothetical protein DFP72DRAFT_1066005 [Tulosesus angulatus]